MIRNSPPSQTTGTHGSSHPTFPARTHARPPGIARRVVVAAACATVSVLVAAPLLGLGVRQADATYARPITTVLAWNTQNLFNDRDDPHDYAEFTSAAGWTRQAYYRRLERLARTIRRAAPGRLPDLLVLSELESVEVGFDLAHDYLRRYRYISGSAPRTTATGVVVLSRVPPERLRTHRVVQVVPGPSGLPQTRWAGRPLVDVTVPSGARLLEPMYRTLAGRSPRSDTVRLLAAHWKSQSGGERETEPRRLMEAALVVGVLAGSSWPRTAAPGVTLLVGDLNEDLHEYAQHGATRQTALMPHDAYAALARREAPRPAIVFEAAGAAASGDGSRRAGPDRYSGGGTVEGVPGAGGDASRPGAGPPLFRSLWPADEEGGTYAYRGRWERLDHAFLLAPDSVGGTLRVVRRPELLGDGGEPWRYDPGTGRGISDHLPIFVTITRRRAR